MSEARQESVAPEPGRRDNGLLAPTYVPLTDVSVELGLELLVALRRSRIAAYLVDAPQPVGAQRLYVAADERSDARTIAASVIKAAGGTDSEVVPQAPRTDPLAGIDADAEFNEMIADWHVDTLQAIRDAERSLSREDENWRAHLNPGPVAEPVWLDDDHFVPPAPPPLPRFAAPTIIAMVVLTVSILLLGLGGEFGLASRLTLLLGVCGVLAGVGMLVMRLHTHRDDDDDGAVL